jgi:hypothetical protein
MKVEIGDNLTFLLIIAIPAIFVALVIIFG